MQEPFRASSTPRALEQSTCTFPFCLQRAGSPAALSTQLELQTHDTRLLDTSAARFTQGLHAKPQPPLRLEQDPASPTAWETALARQGRGWHSHRGTKTTPFGGELLPLHPYGCRDRQQDTVSCASPRGGGTATQTAAERSRRRLPFFSWIFLQCAAHSLGEKQRSVRGGGAARQRSSWGQAIPAGLPGSSVH